MIKRFHLVGAVMGILLGAVHLLFVPLNFDRLTLGAIWFAGAGLSLVFGGFLNLALARSVTGDGLLAGLALTASLILALMFGVALSLLRQPQVIFGLALFSAQAVTAYMLGRAEWSQRPACGRQAGAARLNKSEHNR